MRVRSHGTSVQPVIIIGAARSGTRLIRDTIASHPSVSKVPYDINFIWRLGNENLPHDELTPAILGEQDQLRIRNKILAYNKATPFLIEKTVSNCLRVPFVNAILPNAKFIHLVRDGMDIIESSYRQWTAKPDFRYILAKSRSYPLGDAPGYAFSYARSTINRMFSRDDKVPEVWGPRYRGIEDDLLKKDIIEVCAVQWAECLRKARSALASIPSSRVFKLNYEDFVALPRQYLVTTANFLGLDSTFYNNIDLSSIDQSNIGKGKSGLSSDQIELVTPYLELANFPSTD